MFVLFNIYVHSFLYSFLMLPLLWKFKAEKADDTVLFLVAYGNFFNNALTIRLCFCS